MPIVFSKNPEATWGVRGKNQYEPFPNGSYFVTCTYPLGASNVLQDEWLITPEFTVGENMEFSFVESHNAPYLFIQDSEHVNYDDMTWIKQEVAITLEVYFKVDGGEWVKQWDVTDQYMGKSLQDIQYETTYALIPHAFPLAGYAGKKMQVAFRYYGKDGDTIALDDIRVGRPAPKASYSLPTTTLYSGFAYSSDWICAQAQRAIYPAYENLVFNADNANPDASYTWSYQVPGTSTEIGSLTGSEFSVMYTPNFTSDATAEASIYTFPLLKVESQGVSSTYSSYVPGFQIGGRPFIGSGDNKTPLGLLPFDIDQADVDIYVEDPYDFGESSVPVFGHSNRTTRWWTEHYFDGDAGPEEKAENVAILNYIYPTENPLIVDSAWLLAKGNIGDNAEFKAELIPLNENFEPQEAIATATCKGSDMTWAEGGMQQFYNIYFAFETPAKLSSADAPAYIIKISGFNSDDVEWFAPMMQTKPTMDLCLGWQELTITSDGNAKSTYTPLANFKNDNGEEMWCAFAINLGGTYGYLKQANEGEVAEINAGKLVAEVPMISYYDGSEITVEIRKGFTAEVTGRFNNAKLTITADKEAGASDGEFEAVLKAKSIELCKVPYNVSGIAAIDQVNGDTANAEIVAIYAVDGRRVGNNVDQLPTGIYLVHYDNGTTVKIAR